MQAVFRKALRDSRRNMLWLSIGMAAFALFAVGVYPAILDQQEQLDALIQALPKSFITVFVGDIDLDNFTIADPALYLEIRFVSFMVLILGTVGMVQAFNAITNAERDGTMDLMLSLPISRHDLLLGRMANTALTILVAQTAAIITLVLAMRLVPELDLPTGKVVLAVYSTFFLVMTPAAFAYMLASWVPSSKRWAGGLVYAPFFGSYLVHNFSGTADVLGSIKPLLIFDYYSMGEIVRDGLNVGNIVALGCLVMLCTGVAWWRIDLKDMGV